MGAQKVITIFGSSSILPATKEYSEAQALGFALAKHRFIVCNGGYGGTMEATARGAKEAGGTTIGITAKVFADKALNRWIDREIRVEGHLDRLQTLIGTGDAFVVLRGGTGTLLEYLAVWELINKRMIEKKTIILFGKFWTELTAMIKETIARDGQTGKMEWLKTATHAEETVQILNERFFGNDTSRS